MSNGAKTIPINYWQVVPHSINSLTFLPSYNYGTYTIYPRNALIVHIR